MRMIAGQNVCRYLRITILNAALPGPDGIRRILWFVRLYICVQIAGDGPVFWRGLFGANLISRWPIIYMCSQKTTGVGWKAVDARFVLCKMVARWCQGRNGCFLRLA